MKALDTNVVLRHLLREEARQAAIADELLMRPFYLSLTVLMEVEWVLRSLTTFPREMVAAYLERLIALPTAHIEWSDTVRWAIGRYSVGGDLADLMHLAAATNAERFATFDKKLAKQAGADTPVPVETLTG